jgi:hypothetical protein
MRTALERAMQRLAEQLNAASQLVDSP